MLVLYPADIVAWRKVGKPDGTFNSYGISMLMQRFFNPARQEEVDFSLFTAKDGHQVFPVTTGGNIILVRQYKQGVNDITWELPGGVADGDEIPQAVAVRELREETGHTAQEIIITGTFFIHTRKSPSKCHTLLATGCSHTHSQRLDTDEVIAVYEVTPSEYWDMVWRNEIVEPYTVLGGLFAAFHRAIPFPEL